MTSSVTRNVKGMTSDVVKTNHSGYNRLTASLNLLKLSSTVIAQFNSVSFSCALLHI